MRLLLMIIYAAPLAEALNGLVGLEGVRPFYQRVWKMAKPAHQAANQAVADMDAKDIVAPAIQPFSAGANLVTRGSISMVSRATQTQNSLILPPEDFDAEDLLARVMSPTNDGRVAAAPHSLVARYEGLHAEVQPSFAKELLSMRDEISPGQPRTLHLYASGPHGSALPPHTDPHDVVVLGIFGEKRWQVCAPGGTSPTLPWRVRTNLHHRCREVTPTDIAALDCAEYVVKPGDLLFIPGELARAHTGCAGLRTRRASTPPQDMTPCRKVGSDTRPFDSCCEHHSSACPLRRRPYQRSRAPNTRHGLRRWKPYAER